jgi:hypothetical protein
MKHNPPWQRKRHPPVAAKTTLSPAHLAWARARARRAGRRYPNLVDNMAAVRRQLEETHGGDAPLAGLRGRKRAT